MPGSIKPHRIIDLTPTTRVRHFTLARGDRSRVAVFRAFRFVLAFTALLTFGCSASPAHGPTAVRIDPAFTAEQRSAIADAIDAWDVQAGLTIAIASWGDSSAVPIERDDSLAAVGKLGLTHTETVEHQHDSIRLAGAGTLPGGLDVGRFDFETSAAHELGHLLGLDGRHGDDGCDGAGHSDATADLMYAHGTPDGARRAITAHDVDRVLAIVDRAWP